MKKLMDEMTPSNNDEVLKCRTCRNILDSIFELCSSCHEEGEDIVKCSDCERLYKKRVNDDPLGKECPICDEETPSKHFLDDYDTYKNGHDIKYAEDLVVSINEINLVLISLSDKNNFINKDTVEATLNNPKIQYSREQKEKVVSRIVQYTEEPSQIGYDAFVSFLKHQLTEDSVNLIKSLSSIFEFNNVLYSHMSETLESEDIWYNLLTIAEKAGPLIKSEVLNKSMEGNVSKIISGPTVKSKVKRNLLHLKVLDYSDGSPDTEVNPQLNNGQEYYSDNVHIGQTLINTKYKLNKEDSTKLNECLKNINDVVYRDKENLDFYRHPGSIKDLHKRVDQIGDLENHNTPVPFKKTLTYDTLISMFYNPVFSEFVKKMHESTDDLSRKHKVFIHEKEDDDSNERYLRNDYDPSLLTPIELCKVFTDNKSFFKDMEIYGFYTNFLYTYVLPIEKSLLNVFQILEKVK